MKIIMRITASCILAAGSLPSANAHDANNAHEELTKTRLDIAVATMMRTEGAVNDRQPWRIPGTLMGGDSWPVQQGLTVDETNLTLTHRLEDQIYGVAKIGTHPDGESHSSFNLEHIFIGWRGNDALSPLSIEAGRMSAVFSPSMTEHASTRLFSEYSLAHDAFFGRHFHDDGIRTTWASPTGFKGGIEYWRGNNYPATPTEEGGNIDMFAHYATQNSRWNAEVGVWLMQADAELRADHRYGGGHQHTDSFTPKVADVRFTGKSDLSGVNGKLSWQITPQLTGEIEGEWFNVKAEGNILDAVRNASINSDYAGGFLQTSVCWQKHTFAVRSEELILENTLVGAGAPQLAIDSGLVNNGKNPRRNTLGWLWQWRDNIAWRIEAVSDDSTVENRSRLGLGIIWREKIWTSGPLK